MISGEAENILLERFGADSVISLATISQGIPMVRYVDAYYEDGAFYILTHALSGKMQQIMQNPNVAIAGEWFTAQGTGASLGGFAEDKNRTIAEKMRRVFANWIDNGHTDLNDQHTCILRIKLEHGILFSHGRRFDLDFGEA